MAGRGAVAIPARGTPLPGGRPVRDDRRATAGRGADGFSRAAHAARYGHPVHARMGRTLRTPRCVQLDCFAARAGTAAGTRRAERGISGRVVASTSVAATRSAGRTALRSGGSDPAPAAYRQARPE